MTGRAGAIERRSFAPVGEPHAGAVVPTAFGPGVPVSLSPSDTIWVHDPAWGRDLITALTAAVQALEALQAPVQAQPADVPEGEHGQAPPGEPDDPPRPADKPIAQPDPQEAPDV